MNQYMLVMTGAAKAWQALGPEENQRLMEQYYAFVDMMRKGHGFVGGSALDQAGYGLQTASKKVVVDGPFSETKEVLNGYMIFNAPDFEAAIAIAKQCPALGHGEKVQVFALKEH